MRSCARAVQISPLHRPMPNRRWNERSGLWYPLVENRDEWGSQSFEWRERNRIYERGQPSERSRRVGLFA